MDLLKGQQDPAARTLQTNNTWTHCSCDLFHLRITESLFFLCFHKTSRLCRLGGSKCVWTFSADYAELILYTLANVNV